MSFSGERGPTERLKLTRPVQCAVGGTKSVTNPLGSLGTLTENHSGEMVVQVSAVCANVGAATTLVIGTIEKL